MSRLDDLTPQNYDIATVDKKYMNEIKKFNFRTDNLSFPLKNIILTKKKPS